MQTFLPYPDPRRSAEALDDRRLGKQRVETFQVLRALTWPTYGWKHHPVTRMWRGFVPALVAYGLACVDEWEARGRADATRAALLEFTGGGVPDWDVLRERGEVPPWVGDEALHLSHRSSLVRKDPEFYRPRFGDVPDDLPYVWPDPSFPRWPVRRGDGPPLTAAEAATLLGLDAVPPEIEHVVAELRAGRDVHLPDGQTTSARVVALAAGLATPGTTLWVVDLAPLPPAGDAPPARETSGSVSSSIAREPSPADRVAMREESRAVPEFRFLRRGQVTRGLAAELGAGLVVVERGADPGPAVGVPRLLLP
jgi:hypothetical protein